MLQEYQGGIVYTVLSRTRFIEACLEATSKVQNLVLRMRIYMHGWH